MNCSSKERLNQIKDNLIDKSACTLANQVQWIKLKGLSNNDLDLYPVAILGSGKPILLIHGFDSCFLEFRRLVPLLEKNYKLIIPDLYGFGFSPRPERNDYGIKQIISHLSSIINSLRINSSIGIIGASMGGSIAMELARRNPERIDRLLLLSPAGITANQTGIPWPLNEIGAYFLQQNFVRRSLCRQAFANPKTSVGTAEEEIASIHLKVPGWHRSLALFAKNGGVSDYGKPIPKQPIKVIWGKQDRIIKAKERRKSSEILKLNYNEIENCGHLPHLDKPEVVASTWKNRF